jgi:hypothetical protein
LHSAPGPLDERRVIGRSERGDERQSERARDDETERFHD